MGLPTLLNRALSAAIDALFPLPTAEREALSIAPDEAIEKLQSAPSYSGLAAPLPECRSALAYKDERVSRLIWAVKYKKSRAAVRIAGYVLWHELTAPEEFPMRSMDIPKTIIPMPMTKRRRRERGYNQCELLVDEMERLEHGWATENGIRPRFMVAKDILVRVHHASRQTMKGRSERIESAKGIFSVDEEAVALLRHDQDQDDIRLIVVDDVITTGSTMREALDALKAAGFDRVNGISLAH